ncbi:MAG: hypothetical protein PF961_10740 [Planctomycetota bacterium]|jgi:hypothetical protein|nr:hypothetical protein [Planctomycetota bacterium]
MKIIIVTILLALAGTAASADVELSSFEAQDLLGMTLRGVETYYDTFEGSDGNTLIELPSGAIFRLNDAHYQFIVHPTVLVFASHFTADELRESNRVNRTNYKVPREGIVIFRLAIGRHVYSATRIK